MFCRDFASGFDEFLLAWQDKPPPFSRVLGEGLLGAQGEGAVARKENRETQNVLSLPSRSAPPAAKGRGDLEHHAGNWECHGERTRQTDPVPHPCAEAWGGIRAFITNDSAEGAKERVTKELTSLGAGNG